MEKRNNDIILRGIPPDVKELLWIGHPPGEPSMISFDLEVSKYVDLGSLWYWPSYDRLTPGQRYRYLLWLCDITQPIDFGYVFLFYYGLERHLLYGKFEKAFEMINKLRIYHKAASFMDYSQNAIIIASMVHERLDLIDEIEGLSSNLFLDLMYIYEHEQIDPDAMIKYASIFGWKNKRYIQKNYELFRTLIGEGILITKKDIEESPKATVASLANYTLRPQHFLMHNIFYHPKIQKDVYERLRQTHENFKILNRGKK